MTLIRNWNSCYLEQIIQAVEIALFSADDSSEPQAGMMVFALADVIVILFWILRPPPGILLKKMVKSSGWVVSVLSGFGPKI